MGANPGRKYSSLTFFHWNLNGLTAYDSTKVSLFQAYITQHNIDIICLSETFLISSIQINVDRILVGGYDLIRADTPSNSKRSGVCIYYNSLGACDGFTRPIFYKRFDRFNLQMRQNVFKKQWSASCDVTGGITLETKLNMLILTLY